jgi:hypothetical protein
MAFSKLTRIILFILTGVSLVVVLFFYVSPSTVNIDDMEMRVTEAANPVDMTPMAPLPTVDSTATDSTAVAEEAPVEDVAAIMTPAPVAKSPKEVLSGWELLVWLRTDLILIWAYMLVLFTLLAAIVFPLISVFSNTKSLIRMAIVLAATAILLVAAYLMSSDTPMQIVGYDGTGNTDPGTLKMVDTVLFVTYMLTGLAIRSILYAMISKAIK